MLLAVWALEPDISWLAYYHITCTHSDHLSHHFVDANKIDDFTSRL